MNSGDDNLFGFGRKASPRDIGAQALGSMVTKLQAAELATSRGIDMYITNGQKPETLYDIIESRPAGTLFVGRKGK